MHEVWWVSSIVPVLLFETLEFAIKIIWFANFIGCEFALFRNWYEKEGFDEPEYRTEETKKNPVTFRCTLELPVDDETTGRPLVAEAEVSGKKKEAAAACAMEACRLLDKAGVLRSTHASHQNLDKLRAKRLQVSNQQNTIVSSYYLDIT